MIDVIVNNPYRILGVCSTSPQRDIVANQGKMKAFLKVGKDVSFQLDLPQFLPAISRNTDVVAKAVADLTLATERVKYAQFWFANKTQFDEIAIGKLIEGNIESAIDILKKKESPSSLQNIIVCSLIQNDLCSALHYAEILYVSYTDDFLHMVLGDDATVSPDQLVNSFLNVICNNYKLDEIISFVTIPDWQVYVKNIMISPILDNVSSAIERAKSTKGQSPDERYEAGEKLMNVTKSSVVKIQQFATENDVRCQILLDKLGTEILQCGIDYFNGSDSPTAAKQAMVLQGYALSIVVGKMAKDRCKENVETLNKIINDLPPQEVYIEDKAIKDALHEFNQEADEVEYAITLLNNTKKHLKSIRKKLGRSNTYYIKISTLVVNNALHNVIEETNRRVEWLNTLKKMTPWEFDEMYESQQKEMNELYDSLGLPRGFDSKFNLYTGIGKMDSLMAKIKMEHEAIESLKDTLKLAWKAIRIMDWFTMDREFKKNRYRKNRSILKGLCEKVEISTGPNYGCIIPIIIAIVVITCIILSNI